MKIIHGDGYTPDELRSYKATVCDNLVHSMRAVLEAMGALHIDLGDKVYLPFYILYYALELYNVGFFFTVLLNYFFCTNPLLQVLMPSFHIIIFRPIGYMSRLF